MTLSLLKAVFSKNEMRFVLDVLKTIFFDSFRQ